MIIHHYPHPTHPHYSAFNQWAEPLIEALGGPYPPGPHPIERRNLLPFADREEIILARVQFEHPDWEIEWVRYPVPHWEIICPNCYLPFLANSIQPFLCAVCMEGIKLECEQQNKKFDEQKVQHWAELKAIREKTFLKSLANDSTDSNSTDSNLNSSPIPTRLVFGRDLPPAPGRKSSTKRK